MNREDELIREALKMNISVEDEINRRVLRTVDRKKHSGVLSRTTLVVVTCLITLLGTGIIVNAATGGRMVEYLRGEIDNMTYVFKNGSDVEFEIIQKDDEEWEQVEYIQNNVVMSHPVLEDETEYSLYLKVNDKNGIEVFISLVASVREGETTEELYYAIRGEFLRMITKFRDTNEKEQILIGLKEAAENADLTAVKDALLDLSYDYKENNRIFYVEMSGKWWGEDGDIVFFEDISDLPSGEAAIIVNTVDDRENSWIFVLTIDDNILFVDQYERGEMYREEYYEELLEKEIPIYDLR